MKKDKSGQSAIYRKKIKDMIELYNSHYPLAPADKKIKSALKFFAETYSTEKND